MGSRARCGPGPPFVPPSVYVPSNLRFLASLYILLSQWRHGLFPDNWHINLFYWFFANIIRVKNNRDQILTRSNLVVLSKQNSSLFSCPFSNTPCSISSLASFNLSILNRMLCLYASSMFTLLSYPKNDIPPPSSSWSKLMPCSYTWLTTYSSTNLKGWTWKNYTQKKLKKALWSEFGPSRSFELNGSDVFLNVIMAS